MSAEQPREGGPNCASLLPPVLTGPPETRAQDSKQRGTKAGPYVGNSSGPAQCLPRGPRRRLSPARVALPLVDGFRFEYEPAGD
jgi:hypothetical protein